LICRRVFGNSYHVCRLSNRTLPCTNGLYLYEEFISPLPQGYRYYLLHDITTTAGGPAYIVPESYVNIISYGRCEKSDASRSPLGARACQEKNNNEKKTRRRRRSRRPAQDAIISGGTATQHI